MDNFQFTYTRSEFKPVVDVPRADRWSINHRLQELNIDCDCPSDGTLRVEVNHATALLLVNSVVRRFLCSRQTDIDWLERCWSTSMITSSGSYA